ncbi:Protein MIZU-KUSSEI 1-like, plant [Sesbania bispinosa]|nr:Protein MIZU-KUSSEI 1-like, plant [Sesbania bispinosa]
MDTTSSTPQDLSSKRHFHWTNKVGNEDGEVPTSETMSKIIEEETKEDGKAVPGPAATSQATRKKLQAVAISRLRSVLTVFGKNRSNLPFGLGSRVVGTLFGYRRGHEPLWRTYCNGKKSGFATRRECGEKDWDILKAVEPISMGAGVLPGAEAGSDGEVMYMRARFERIVGSRDSEAFYMMNPDSNGAPELSVYLLRV